MVRRNIQLLSCAVVLAAGSSVAAQAPGEQPPADPVKPTGEQQQQQQARESAKQEAAPTMPGLARLDRAEKKALQRALREQGSYRGAIDGIFGEGSQQALKEFQREHGLEENGISRQTVNALGVDFEQAQAQAEAGAERQPVAGAKQAQRQPARGQAQQAQAVDISALGQSQVRTMQEKLQEQGVYRGEIDGMAGDGTQQALRRFFQRQARLAARGRIMPESAEALGLSAADMERARGQQGPEQRRMRGEEAPREEAPPQQEQGSPTQQQNQQMWKSPGDTTSEAPGSGR